jgi:hypothetical protein
MRKILERSVAAIEDRLLLIAPPDVRIHKSFRNVCVDAAGHDMLVRQVQAMRGQVYLADGAIQRHQLTRDGRHQTSEDVRAWHLVMTNRLNRVTACLWYLEHDPSVTVDELRVRQCPLVQIGWRDRLWAAVSAELGRARREKLRYAEIGGWAVAPEYRGSTKGLALALASFALGRVSGGALGITTATVRHCSSSILRRVGGYGLEADGEAIPSYFDDRYNCEMELLRFDSRRPSPAYAGIIEQLRGRLAGVRVIVPARAAVDERGDVGLGRTLAIPAGVGLAA